MYANDIQEAVHLTIELFVVVMTPRCSEASENSIMTAVW